MVCELNQVYAVVTDERLAEVVEGLRAKQFADRQEDLRRLINNFSEQLNDQPVAVADLVSQFSHRSLFELIHFRLFQLEFGPQLSNCLFEYVLAVSWPTLFPVRVKCLKVRL